MPSNRCSRASRSALAVESRVRQHSALRNQALHDEGGPRCNPNSTSVSICTGAGASSSGESAEGETLEVTKINNDDLLSFERAVMAAGEHPEVVLEACYGGCATRRHVTGWR